MPVPLLIERQFNRISNLLYKLIPQPFPDRDRVRSCRVVSHRGEHDNRRILENTIPAFDAVLDHGIWGIEFDIRWTKDFYPVVFHDQDLKRLYGTPTFIRDIKFPELKQRFPLIPSLDEVVARYGKKLHLMIELKKEHCISPELLVEQLRKSLFTLSPETDFHILSLFPAVFNYIEFFPAGTFVPVAELNVSEFSDLSLSRGYGGISGHFLFMKNKRIKLHHRSQQHIGTGFIGSRNSLFRELNRKVDWIFTNDAVKIQSICKEF